ncbi:hypothetical protein JTM75_33985, partial [Pseudomonas aeruginosa]|nr:hypothetical protein [Pseudomonas aeruginosa]
GKGAGRTKKVPLVGLYRGALVGGKAGKYCQMLRPDEAETRMLEGLCIHTARFWDPTNKLRTSYPQGGYLALPK